MERTSAGAILMFGLFLALGVLACASSQGPAFDIPTSPEAQAAKTDCDESFERCAHLRSRGDGYCNRAWSRCYNGIPGSRPRGGGEEEL